MNDEMNSYDYEKIYINKIIKKMIYQKLQLIEQLIKFQIFTF